jgi:hypothetical protein
MQLICWAVFFALQPSARVHLRRAGPWLALLVFGICTTPVIIWNAQHHWITVDHLSGDGGFTGDANASLSAMEILAKSLNYFLEFTTGEFAALNPIFFIGALLAFVIAWKRRAEKPLWLFLLSMSAPVFLGHRHCRRGVHAQHGFARPARREQTSRRHRPDPPRARLAGNRATGRKRARQV